MMRIDTFYTYIGFIQVDYKMVVGFLFWFALKKEKKNGSRFDGDVDSLKN